LDLDMLSLSDVKTAIEAALPGADVEVTDLGGGDHLKAVVVASQFEGKSLVQQHQLVYGAVRADMDSGVIHALALETHTPQSWASRPRS
jgi:acid stress-induced BolA-like protein IbaG/YrbA